MYRSVALSLLVCFVATKADTNADSIKTKEGGGFYGENVAAGVPVQTMQQVPMTQQFQYPANMFSMYQPVALPAPFALPNVDLNYCSVHASFPIVEIEAKNRFNRSKRSYGFQQMAAAPATGSGFATYGQYPQMPFNPRRFDRQGCRHVAIFSQNACDTCCKISSRGQNTNAEDITGALFVFTPDMEQKTKGDETDAAKEEPKKAVQCVCCAPRKV